MNTYEKIFTEKYSILNEKQKQAVDSIDGPVFVMAGPGTGKTQILTLRIANILREATDIEPENILALTFTDAAAYNMRERLSQIIGSDLAYRVTISTFHSFAEDLIKKFPEYFPNFVSARLLSPVEQIELLEEILDAHKSLRHFSKFKRREGTVKSIAFSLGKIKSEGLSSQEFIKQVDEKYHLDASSPDMFYKRKYGNFQKGDLKISALRKLDARREKSLELAEIYEAYAAALQNKKLYDFSDLILSCVQELSSDSEFQAEIQEQYHYILVDEHQDTNDAQNNILYALIDNPVWEAKPNIFVVGDSKQAIFRFAGASEESYTALLAKLHEPKIIALEKNYRSHQQILDHSHSLISKSESHKDEVLLDAFFNHEGKFEYREFQNYKMENLYIAQNIRDRMNKGQDLSEIAVLYRNNKDGEDLRRLLAIYAVPVQDYSKKNILKDPDVLKIFLLLKSIYNLEDDENLAKSLFIDFLDFKVFDVQKIVNAAKRARDQHNKRIFSLISDKDRLVAIGLDDIEIEKFIEFSKLLEEAKSESENTDFLSFFSYFIRKSGFLAYVLSHKDSSVGISKIEKLFDEIRKESMARGEFSFKNFIHYISTLKKHSIAMNITNALSSGVQMMTFHGSKGLEFDTVFITKALQKRRMGSEISLPFEDFSDGDSEDERRLMYVAITRAKKECYISSHILNAEGKEKNASQFISEIDGIQKIDVQEWEQEHSADIADIFGSEEGRYTSLLDKEYIQKLFLSKQLSVSALNNYMESPLKYFFRNLVALPEARSHFLDFGNLMHGSLEHYFDKCKDKNEILPLIDLQESFAATLDSKPYYHEFKERAWTMLESYFSEKREGFVVPVENELSIRGVQFEISETESINLSGAIDKITRSEDGSLTVWDYKTGRSYSDMDKGRKEKTKRQATFYKMLLQHAYGGKYNFKTAIFEFLEKNEAGEFEQKEFEIMQEDIDNLREQILALVADIKNGSLLEKDFSKDSTNAELLEFLEVMRGPRTGEQKSLFE